MVLPWWHVRRNTTSSLFPDTVKVQAFCCRLHFFLSTVFVMTMIRWLCEIVTVGVYTAVLRSCFLSSSFFFFFWHTALVNRCIVYRIRVTFLHFYNNACVHCFVKYSVCIHCHVCSHHPHIVFIITLYEFIITCVFIVMFVFIVVVCFLLS